MVWNYRHTLYPRPTICPCKVGSLAMMSFINHKTVNEFNSKVNKLDEQLNKHTPLFDLYFLDIYLTKA